MSYYKDLMTAYQDISKIIETFKKLGQKQIDLKKIVLQITEAHAIGEKKVYERFRQIAEANPDKYSLRGDFFIFLEE